jgi:hypothetical protein
VSGAAIVFVALFAVGVALEAVGRVTRVHPTISDIARSVHRHRWGGWLLFAMWALVGWHLLVS